MKMYVWKTPLGTQYWVLATSLEQAKEKMLDHFDASEILEQTIRQTPNVHPAPDVIAVFDPSRTQVFGK
jgi:hypothetical protein